MLQWNHDWGTKAEHWQSLFDQGRRVPDGFLDRPDVMPASTFYCQAFYDLGTERPGGMTLGPIPRSKVFDYAVEHGMSGDEFDHLWSIIQELDSAQMKIVSAKPVKRPTPDYAREMKSNTIKSRPTKNI